MAFYAPRGITPEEVRRMDALDRAVLRVGRARWYEDMALVTQAGVAHAFEPPEQEARNGEK